MPPEIDEAVAHVPTEKEVAQNPRMLAMEAIRVQRDGDDEQTSNNAADDQLALQTETAPRVLTDGLDRTMVRVKVDGVEQEIPVADVVRSYQKDAAAQARLNEATRVLDEARRTAAAAIPRLQLSSRPRTQKLPPLLNRKR